MLQETPQIVDSEIDGLDSSMLEGIKQNISRGLINLLENDEFNEREVKKVHPTVEEVLERLNSPHYLNGQTTGRDLVESLRGNGFLFAVDSSGRFVFRDKGHDLVKYVRSSVGEIIEFYDDECAISDQPGEPLTVEEIQRYVVGPSSKPTGFELFPPVSKERRQAIARNNHPGTGRFLAPMSGLAAAAQAFDSKKLVFPSRDFNVSRYCITHPIAGGNTVSTIKFNASTIKMAMQAIGKKEALTTTGVLRIVRV